jgi:hypothetical protein
MNKADEMQESVNENPGERLIWSSLNHRLVFAVSSVVSKDRVAVPEICG